MTAELHPIVQVDISTPPPSWIALPPQPWPQIVRLSAHTDEAGLALVAATLCSSGNSPAESPEALLDRLGPDLPGGIQVIDGDREYVPGCCCSLEQWLWWRDVLEGGPSPWTGHVTAPLVELQDDRVLIWSDGGEEGGPKPVDEDPVAMSRGEFTRALQGVGADIGAFLDRFHAWWLQRAPHHADAIVARLREINLDARN